MWSENGRMNHGKRRWASLAAIISLRLLIARQRRLQETSGWPHALQNPLMYTYMLQTPLLCAPSDYLYTADFQNVRAHGGEQTP